MSDDRAAPRQSAQEAEEHPGGCAFVLDATGVLGGTSGSPGPVSFCSAPSQPGSAYCPPHHACCHLANGSVAERRQLREIEALAEAVGGKRGRAARRPPARLLRRLDRVARAASPPENSPIVLIVLEDADGSATGI